MASWAPNANAHSQRTIWAYQFTYGDLDDLLFTSIVFMGFHALMCLGKLTQPDSEAKCTFLKVFLHHMVVVTSSTFSFILPSHKADRFFEGNSIVIESRSGSPCPHKPFVSYLAAWDVCFPLHPPTVAHLCRLTPHIFVGGTADEDGTWT